MMQKLFQLFLALIVFGVFSLYVYQAHLAYELTENIYAKVSLFTLGVFTGSFSYDIAKFLALLDEDKFSKIFGYFRKALISTSVMVVFCVISAVLFSFEDFAFKYWGFWAYLVALYQVISIVANFTKAIEAANDQ